jgi:hypothetical protein
MLEVAATKGFEHLGQPVGPGSAGNGRPASLQGNVVAEQLPLTERAEHDLVDRHDHR